MKTVKAVVQLEGGEGFNNMPGREQVLKMLAPIFYSEQAWRPVDVIEGPAYWVNASDTLVIEVDPEEVWRFGGKSSFETAIALANFVQQSGIDEFHTQQHRGKFILRFWWD